VRKVLYTFDFDDLVSKVVEYMNPGQEYYKGFLILEIRDIIAPSAEISEIQDDIEPILDMLEELDVINKVKPSTFVLKGIKDD
jgi:hypothetical protein